MKTLNTLLMLALGLTLSTLTIADDVKPGKQRHSPEEKMKQLDHDGDGRISYEEFLEGTKARMEKRFKRLDANGDGYVELAEFQQAREKRAERYKERRKEFCQKQAQ